MNALAPFYLWIKALHIVSVVAWMAGLFYLPRLFVYHADAAPGSAMAETFKIMERRLLRGIMNPAMIATWTFGILLIATPGIVDWGAGWIYVKLSCVLALTVFQHLLSLWRKAFAVDANRRSSRFYRSVNEVPTALLLIIVAMVVVRPF